MQFTDRVAHDSILLALIALKRAMLETCRFIFHRCTKLIQLKKLKRASERTHSPVAMSPKRPGQGETRPMVGYHQAGSRKVRSKRDVLSGTSHPDTTTSIAGCNLTMSPIRIANVGFGKIARDQHVPAMAATEGVTGKPVGAKCMFFGSDSERPDV
jgi:hypothetical protein